MLSTLLISDSCPLCCLQVGCLQAPVRSDASNNMHAKAGPMLQVLQLITAAIHLCQTAGVWPRGLHSNMACPESCGDQLKQSPDLYTQHLDSMPKKPALMTMQGPSILRFAPVQPHGRIAAPKLYNLAHNTMQGPSGKLMPSTC